MKTAKIHFVVSDIHGFYNELLVGLGKAGYDKNDDNHILVVAGDVFDRGPGAIEVYEYLKSIPQDRLVLLKGNHEDLYLELLGKDYPEGYDFSNETVDTFCQIAGMEYAPGKERIRTSLYLERLRKSPRETKKAFGERIVSEPAYALWHEIREAVAASEVTAWLRSPAWKDYFEVGDLIVTHSFLPLSESDGGHLRLVPNWRAEATPKQWAEARWGCPWRNYQLGLFREESDAGKTLVCGHWHTADFFEHLAGMPKNTNQSIYRGNNIIAIDGGVYHDWYEDTYIHPQNVLVIAPTGICDSSGEELEPMEAELETPIIETVPATDLAGKEARG